MGHKIITEKDFWICTSGLAPAQLQSTQLVTYKQSGEKYITIRDKATSSWIDFSCTKYILLAALAVVAVVAVAIVVGIITVATGGLGLLAIGALAGLIGGFIGAVVGALMCGQKMAAQREWVIPKTDFIILGAPTITGDCTMICPAGGTVKFAPNIKNWWQAVAVGGANFVIKMLESAALGAMILPAAVPLLSGGAALAMPTAASVWGNFAASFGGLFGAFRGLSALDQLPNQIATGESGMKMASTAFFGALPEAEFVYRAVTTRELRPTDALLLLYFLNLKARPTPEPANAPRNEPTAPRDEPTQPRQEEPNQPREEEPNKPREEEPVAPANNANTPSSGTRRPGEFETFEDGQTPLTPSRYGLNTIADDPVLHRMWQQSMADAMSTGKSNAFTRYLDKMAAGLTPTQAELEAAFAKVRDGFLPNARRAGYTIDEVHHWNYGKTLYPNQVVDPRNLVPVPDRATHTQIHRETSSGTNYFKDPIAPEHVLPIDESQIPLAPPAPPPPPGGGN